MRMHRVGPNLLTCANGHQWHVTDKPIGRDTPFRCPACGAAVRSTDTGSAQEPDSSREQWWNIGCRVAIKGALEGGWIGIRIAAVLVVLLWFLLATVVTVIPGRMLAACLEVLLLIPALGMFCAAIGGLAGFVQGAIPAFRREER